jgi:dihydropteroate synthase
MPESRILETPAGPIRLDRTRVMGIVNVTPDSFYPGSRCPTVAEAVERCLAMEGEGADLLDIGGESTRPGSPRLSVEEELARVVPVLEALRGRLSIPVSVDTYKHEVAAAALDAGAAMVNDVTALRGDLQMARLVASRKVPVVLMHALWPPETMQDSPEYVDVVEDVCGFLEERCRHAVGHGVRRDAIVVDPGIGFGKTLAHNLELLRNIPRLMSLGFPVLVGPSRKAFIGELTGRAAPERMAGTAAAVAVCAASGAHILRVHDVGQMKDVVRLVDAVVWQV